LYGLTPETAIGAHVFITANEMKKIVFALLVSTCFTGAGMAATVYRCGAVYSDKPCSQGPTKVTPMWGASPVSSDPVPNLEAVTEACKAWIRDAANWKDADSLKITPLVSTGMTVIGEGSEARAVYAYHTRINAKNSYGGYTGPKSAICYLNEQRTKIIGGRLPN
jgi:hypothetical protein